MDAAMNQTKTIPLSKRQAEGLTVIATELLGGRVAPTVDEFATAMNVGRITAYEIMCVLESKGYIKRYKFVARGIELLDPARAFISQRFDLVPRAATS